MKLLKYVLLIFFLNISAQAITLNNVIEVSQFGMETSGKEACVLSEVRLFDKARREAGGGETISAESYKICKSSEDENQCNYFTNSFYSIASIQIVNYEALKFNDGKECKITLLENDIFEVTRKGNFTLKKTPKQNDNFDFRINLNNTEYVSYPLNVSKKLLDKNDTLNISIETMEDMYIYIFQWLPFQDINSVFKIFPNTFDQDNYFETDISHTIPTSKAFKEYNLKVHFPNEDEIFDNDIQEFLMFIGTKEKINFFDKYNYADFGKKLASIKNLRQHQKSYIIHKRHEN